MPNGQTNHPQSPVAVGIYVIEHPQQQATHHGEQHICEPYSREAIVILFGRSGLRSCQWRIQEITHLLSGRAPTKQHDKHQQQEATKQEAYHPVVVSHLRGPVFNRNLRSPLLNSRAEQQRVVP